MQTSVMTRRQQCAQLFVVMMRRKWDNDIECGRGGCCRLSMRSFTAWSRFDCLQRESLCERRSGRPAVLLSPFSAPVKPPRSWS
jgi:hypothetical protein